VAEVQTGNDALQRH